MKEAHAGGEQRVEEAPKVKGVLISSWKLEAERDGEETKIPC